jgi:hypothetical protein
VRTTGVTCTLSSPSLTGHLVGLLLLLLLLQAPKVFAELCIHGYQRHPTQYCIQGVTSSALETLLKLANSQGATASGTRLAAATLQQLQQAGLPQHLPELLTHAAQGLTAVAARLQLGAAVSWTARWLVGC